MRSTSEASSSSSGPWPQAHSWSEGCVEPIAKQQRHFDVQPIVGDRSAPAFDRALHAVLHGVGMQVEFRCGRFVA